MNALGNWTDEELIQVYDLQEKYAEKVVDFVRHGEESEVLKFMNLISAMHSCDDLKIFDKEIYRKNEFVAEMSREKIPQGRFVYKDLFEHWKGADSLREIFEEKYLWEFAEAQPADLALFANNKEVALGKYSAEKYEKLRNALPEKLKEKIKNLIMNYPKEIEEKAIQIRIYGYTSAISNYALLRYRNEHMPEFEKLQFIVQQEKLPVLENHKICMFGTVKEKLKIYKKDGFSDVADKDFEIILDELAKKYEREGFSRKYYPSKSGNKNYSKQSYKVIGRVKTEDEFQPQWNIIFADGKIITAKADEIISTAINERLYGEQFEKFGKRPLSEVLISTDNEKLSLSEGKEKISAIINQLQANGENIGKLKEFLEDERKNLSNANVR